MVEMNGRVLALGTFKWGEDIEVDLDRLPKEVVYGLVTRTLAHKLGNEVAAQVSRLKEKAEKDQLDWDDDIADGHMTDLQKAMLEKLYDGTIGLGVIGPRGSTLERIAQELAAAEAEAKLAPLGAWPKEDRKNKVKAEDAVVDFNGTMMNREQLTEMVYQKYKARFDDAAKAERQKRIDEAKAKKAAAIPVKKKIDQSIDDLI